MAPRPSSQESLSLHLTQRQISRVLVLVSGGQFISCRASRVNNRLSTKLKIADLAGMEDVLAFPECIRRNKVL